jgi:uncharacterized protein
VALSVVQAVASSLREALLMLWETLWALVVGFALSGAVQAFVTRPEMERVLGRRNLRSLAMATGLGAASSSCSYAASAMAKSLFAKGADLVAALVFMFASTNLVIELGAVLLILLGWQFVAGEVAGGLLMIVLLAAVARVAFPPRLVEAARRRLAREAGPGEVAEPRAPLHRRLRSLAGWSDAAAHTLADITMLRRELVIGFVVAGLLATLVPDALWSSLFLSGHGIWSSLENVAIGPFIAIVSFVCSVGNVPLAAALWRGGISFGGVVSFIFADLITLPLLLVYRRFYGGRLALRMLAAFWLVMSLAGLAVERIAAATGVLPTHRSPAIAAGAAGLTPTTVLDVLSLVLLAGLWYLAHNRERLGGGTGYATDPVCGMQVLRASAPARLRHQGTTRHFCCDGCRDRFSADPERFGARAPVAAGGRR